MKKEFLEFIEYYFEQLNVYLENTAEQLSYKKHTPEQEAEIYSNNFEIINQHKSQIPKILKQLSLTQNDLDTYINHPDIIGYVGDLYAQYGIKKQDKTSIEILETFVSNNIKIDKSFKKVISKLQNFLDSNNINDLYNLTEVDFDLDYQLPSDNKRSTFLKVFKNSLKNVEKSKKAELFSQLNIFIEKYNSTDLGKKHLELIKINYQKEFNKSVEEKDKELATLNFIQDLLNAYNNCTATTSNIFIEKSKIKIEKADGGIFDSLFFINTTKISQELKKSFDLIDNMEDFKKFKKNIDDISQYQISATADKSFRIESTSVVKHSLSSAIINKILNLYYIESKDPQFPILFSKQIEQDKLFNNNITGALNEAFKYVLKDLSVIKKECDTPEQFLRHIQQEINSNPLSYIDYLNQKYYNSNKIPKFNNKHVDLKEEDFYKFENLEDKLRENMRLNKEQNLFSNKSIICFYREEIGYKTEDIKIDTKNVDTKFKQLTTTDFMLLIQFNAIIKSSNYGKDSFDFKTTEDLTNRFIEIRGIGVKFKYNNELIKQIKIEDIDKMIIDTFILGKDAKINLESIKNNKDMDNLVRAIILYATNQNDNIKKEIYEKIIYFSDDVTKLRIAINQENNFTSIKKDLNYIKSIKEEMEMRLQEKEERIKAQEETNQERAARIKAQEETNQERAERIKDQENSILSIIETHIEFRSNKKQFENMLNSKLEIFKKLKESNITNIIEFVKNSKNESFIQSFNDFLEKNHFIKSDIEFPESFHKIDIVFKEIKKYIDDKDHQQNNKNKKYSEEENSNQSFYKLKEVITENITDQNILSSLQDRLTNSGILVTPEISKILNKINFNEKKEQNNTNGFKL